MIRLNIVAEGQTEQRFVGNVLKPHLASMGVYVSCRCIISSWDQRLGLAHRGGISKFSRLRKDICRWALEDQSARLTTMIDVYGLPSDFPRVAELSAIADRYSAVQKLEEVLAAEVACERFIPYLQLHEFEGILLCQPESFRASFPDISNETIAVLERLRDSFESPELINSGSKTSPSKRIASIFPEFQGMKAVAGPVIAEHIGLETIRDRCPHFGKWLAKLEKLAQP